MSTGLPPADPPNAERPPSGRPGSDVPRPDDGREARIAELRARRRARARTLAIRGALGTLALSVLAAVFLAWLLLSFSGRDLLLARIVALLPAGSELTWERAEGPAAGPLTLHGVRFVYAGCAEDTAGAQVGVPNAPPNAGAAADLRQSRPGPGPDSDPASPPGSRAAATVGVPRPVTASDDDASTPRPETGTPAPALDRPSLQARLDSGCPENAAENAVVRTVFTAARLTLDPDVLPLLGSTLRLESLEVEDATLVLGHSDEPFALPRWPDVLPALPMPLRVESDRLSVRGLRVLQAQPPAGPRAPPPAPTPVIAIARLDGGVALDDGALLLREVVADTDRGWFRAHGDYLPRDRYRMDLVVGARLPPVAGRTPARLGLVARGDVRDLVVAVSGDAPAPLRATLRLQGKDTPRWRFAAASTALDPALLAGGPDDDGLPLSFDLKAEGTGGDARLQGRLTRGDLDLRVLPSRIGLAEQVLTLSPLSVAVAGGGIGVRGRLSLADPADPTFDGHLAARRLRWQGEAGSLPVEGGGDLRIAGRLADWRAEGQARLRRDGTEAEIAMQVRGDADQAGFERLQATTPGGSLVGEGRVRWAPALAWDTRLALQGFDPSFLLPDWPGAVDARLISDGRTADDGALAFSVQAEDLGGRLRGRALGGQAQASLHLPAGAGVGGMHGEGTLDLRIGESRVQAEGEVDQRLSIDARFAPLRLDDALPGAAGTLQGTLQLRGPRAAPDIAVDLDGSGLDWAGYRIGRLRADGRLPWRSGDGALRLQAEDAAIGLAFDRLDIDARGAVEALRVDASADSAGLALALAGEARRRGTQWQGTLARLRIAPDALAAWTLTAPAAWRWSAGRLGLDEACFLAEGADSGRLCARAQWPGRATVEGRDLPLALIAPLLPQRDRRDGGGRWLPEGRVDLDLAVVPRGASWQGTAQLRSESGGLSLQQRSRRELLGYTGLRADVDFDPQRIAIELQSGLRPEGQLEAQLSTGWDAYAPLSGRIVARTGQLTWMELLSPDIVEPQGRLEADLRLAGTRGAPAFDGSAVLSAFRADLPALGTGLRNGEVRLDADATGVARIAGSAQMGEGTLRVDGSYDWRSPESPLVLAVTGQNIRVSDTRELRATVDPAITVRYAAGQPLSVAGTVRIPSARMDLEGLSGGATVSDDVVVLDPVHPDEGPATPLDLDLSLEMGRDVRLRGFGLDGTLTGNVRMRARPGREAVANGQLEVAGQYTAYGQELEIVRGRLIWSNRAFSDPILDIRAQREMVSVTAGIDVTGRASAPQAEVWSDPATSQSEALSYLALGRPLSALSAEESRNVGAASAALSAGGNLLAGQIAQKIGLDDAGIGESRALGGSVVGIGKYLSPRLYVSYGVSLLGTGQVLTLRYLLRKGFDIEIESSSVENRGSVNWRKEK